jgi:hypothetical protein
MFNENEFLSANIFEEFSICDNSFKSTTSIKELINQFRRGKSGDKKLYQLVNEAIKVNTSFARNSNVASMVV